MGVEVGDGAGARIDAKVAVEGGDDLREWTKGSEVVPPRTSVVPISWQFCRPPLASREQERCWSSGRSRHSVGGTNDACE